MAWSGNIIRQRAIRRTLDPVLVDDSPKPSPETDTEGDTARDGGKKRPTPLSTAEPTPA